MDSNSTIGVFSTALLGAILLRLGLRLRGGGPGRGGACCFFGVLGILGVLAWLTFAVERSDSTRNFFNSLRGGASDPLSSQEYSLEDAPQERFTVFFLQPFAKCTNCSKEVYMKLQFGEDREAKVLTTPAP